MPLHENPIHTLVSLSGGGSKENVSVHAILGPVDI